MQIVSKLMLSVPKQVSFEHRSAVTTPAIPIPDITYEASGTATTTTTTALAVGTASTNGHSSSSESGKANGGLSKGHEVQEEGKGQVSEVSVEQLLEWCHSSLSDAVFDVDYNGMYM